MITREQFIEKVNSFNLGEEQTNKCIEYYDNPSKSTSKEKVIDEASAEDLVKTVNKWYGIKNSTKEKKPRTKKVDIQGKLDELNSFVDSIIANGNEDGLYDLDEALTSISSEIRKTKEGVAWVYKNGTIGGGGGTGSGTPKFKVSTQDGTFKSML